MKDLIKINNFLEKKQESHSQIYHAVQDSNHLYRPFLENFLTSHNLPITPKTLMAVATRLVSLRDDALLLCAKEEGLDDIATLFEQVAAIEKEHENRYKKLLKNIEDEVVFSNDGDTIWICRNCGHIVVGKKAPEVCPVCKHKQSFFERKANNY